VFKEYAKLFTDANQKVREMVARNPNASKFKEYHLLGIRHDENDDKH
jgi:hypothetical protein